MRPIHRFVTVCNDPRGCEAVSAGVPGWLVVVWVGLAVATAVWIASRRVRS